MRERASAIAIVAVSALLVVGGTTPALAKKKRPRVAPRGTVVSRSLFAWDLAVQPDGRIVTVGRNGGRTLRTVVARRLDNGQLDPTFRNGVVAVASKALMFLIALQPDGRILIAGEAPGTGMSADGSPADFILARLLPTGQLDPSFGSGGVVRTDFGADDGPSALTIQDDGRILLAGHADRGYPDRANPDSSFAVARYEPNGSLDPSFGAGGRVLVSFGRFNTARAMRVSADGRIALAGTNQLDPGANEPERLAQARLLTDGSLDPSFGTGGQLVTPFLAPGEDVLLSFPPFVIYGLTYATDGRLVAAGEASVKRGKRIVSLTKVARYGPDGAPDPSFGLGGRMLLNQRKMGRVNGVATTAGGGIVVAGLTNSIPEGVQLVRLTPGGVLEAGFGRSGSVKTRLPGTAVDFPAVTFDPLGRVLVAGFTGLGRGGQSVIARYQASGRLDRTFGPRHRRHHRKRGHHHR
jgi:uncharacterized delta-60 repeat protein